MPIVYRRLGLQVKVKKKVMNKVFETCKTNMYQHTGAEYIILQDKHVYKKVKRRDFSACFHKRAEYHGCRLEGGNCREKAGAR